MANSQSGSTSSTSYLSPLSLFSRLSLFSVAATLLFSTEAISAPIHQETFTGNGESRVLTSRTITASEGGRYFLTLKNGDLGPRSIEQCETEDTAELKRECLFNNLTEKIDQDFSRIQDALIHLNGVRVRNHLAPNEKTITRTRGLLKIPVNLVQGANTLNIDLLGYSTSKLFLDLEKAPETPLPPFAAFTLNRLKGNTTQSFTLNARESFSPEAGTLTYSWLWGDEPEGTLPTIGTSTATHTYQTAGTYRAKLIVTDTVSNLSSEFGIDLVVTAIDPVNPPENEKPRPVIQMALDSENPMRIHLNGLQSTDDGTISNYAWRITNQSGQHTNLIGETLSYTFTQSGSYTIRLTVTDDLGLKTSVDRVTSVAPLSLLVRDEILFSPKQYFGTFETESQTIEPLNIPQGKLAVLKIKNADGEDHLIEDCSTIGWPEKIGCLYTNLVNSTYIKLYRVNTANVYVNGRKVTDSTSITKQKKYFETIISLNEVNTLDIRVRGWPTAFITLEVQALETNIAPIASFTFPQPTRGVPQAIEFNAASSTDENDQIVSYRFLAKKSGEQNYSYDSDWIATPNHQITFTEAGAWDVVVSARDKFGAIGTTSQQLEILPNTLPTLTAVYNILSNQSPFRVQVRATGQDQDGDALQYNFSFSNGQTTGFQSSNIAISNFAASGAQQVVVTVRDQNGGESSTTLNFELGNNLIPIASFAFATARAGYAPLTVAFDASSSSDPDGPTENLRYFWQFGDGTPLTEGKILEHTFQNGGEYIVTLSVADAFRGTGTQSRAVFSWVTAPPIPRYTVTPIPGTLQVTFDASGSTAGDSAIQSYAFEPGNGQTIRQASPVYTHTYLNGGVYSTSLRVYDLEGDANITGQVINVFNGQKPAANINLVSSDVITPATFVFNANGSATPNAGATLNGWKWTLPNGEVRLGPNMTYTTSLNGTFDITLEVRDSLGFWSDPVTRTYAAATGVLPIANITASKTTALVGEVIQFSGLNSYTLNAGANLVTYEWTTPNGSTLFGPEVQFGLNVAGLQTVTLKVTDSKGYVSETKSIQINVIEPSKPVAVMALADGGNIIPVTRHGDARGSYAVAAGAVITGYEWRIDAPEALPNGIDFSLFGPEVDILFNQEVTYTVSLRVFDSQGGTSDWVSETFGPLQNTKPIAIMNPQTLTTVAPSMVFFTSFGSSDPDGHTIINYYWNFGDGTESYEPSVNHYYENPGVYQVELSVQDQFGKWSDSIFGVVTVTENVAPIAIITMENDPAGNRFKKLFSASQSSDSDGSIVNYSWYIFGSGVFATGVNTEFTFPGPGTYTMGLDVYDDKGARTQTSYLVEIPLNAPPVAKIRITNIDHQTRTVTLTAEDSTHDSLGLTYAWDFGDGETSTDVAPVHVYPYSGTVGATLTVTDSNGISAAADLEFGLFDSPIKIQAKTSSGNYESIATSGQILAVSAIPSSVEFSLSSGDASADRIPVAWTFSDGTSSLESTLSKSVLTPDGFTATASFTDHLGVAQSQTISIRGTEEGCIDEEYDNACLAIKNTNPGAIAPIQTELRIGFFNKEFPENPDLQVEISQDEIVTTLTEGLSISNGELILPISHLKDVKFNQLNEYSIRIIASDTANEEAEAFSGSVKNVAFAKSTADILVSEAALPVQLKLTNIETLKTETLLLTSANTVIENLPQGGYQVEGESSIGELRGAVTLINDDVSYIRLVPKTDVLEVLSDSVFRSSESHQTQGSSSGAFSSPTNLKFSSQVSMLNTGSGSNCTSENRYCEYALVSSPYQSRPTQDPVFQNSKNLGKIVDVGRYSLGGYELKSEPSIRSFDERFQYAPGEKFVVECKGHTTAWNKDLLRDREGMLAKATALAVDSTNRGNQILERYSTLSLTLKSLCSPYHNTNQCNSLLLTPSYATYLAEWNSYIAWRAPQLEAIARANDYINNEFDYAGSTAYEVGRISRHSTFNANFTLTRYKNDGTPYLNSNGKTEFQNLSIEYDTAKMRGNYSREQALFNNGFRRNPFDVIDGSSGSGNVQGDNSSRSIIKSVLIPSHWENYRVTVTTSSQDAYNRKLIQTPTGTFTAESSNSFACRPAERTGAFIELAAADPVTLNGIVSKKAANTPLSNFWTYSDIQYRRSDWNILESLSIVRQQALIESLSSAASETGQISDPIVKELARDVFEVYKANSFFSAGNLGIFPMDIDLDTSIHRNSAYSILMHTTGTNFSATQITESDFDLRFRFAFTTSKVRSISRVNILLNGIPMQTVNFAEPITPNPFAQITYSPPIVIPYQLFKNAVSALPGTATGNSFDISFSTDSVSSTGQAITTLSPLTITAMPVWNLKSEVLDPSGTTQDEQLGLYGGKASAYGGIKLRNVLRGLVDLRNAYRNDSNNSFRLFINDGTLPFGGKFSPHGFHNNGRHLDIRPLGNTGQSGSHYDTSIALRRINDLAVVWAESAFRFDSCQNHPPGTPERTACEANATSTFSATVIGDSFPARRNRLVQWINRNHLLAELPSSISSNGLVFKFSNGLLKFDELCEGMVTAYRRASNDVNPPSGCEGKVNGAIWTEQDLNFQEKILFGRLPNEDTIRIDSPSSGFIQSKFIYLRAEEAHYDHFHLEVSP